VKEYITMPRTHHFEGHPTGTHQVGEKNMTLPRVHNFEEYLINMQQVCEGLRDCARNMSFQGTSYSSATSL
jgi:hypothetical protein